MPPKHTTLKRTVKLPRLRRILPIDIRRIEGPTFREDGKELELYDIAISSETPVERRDFLGHWIEVLSHDPDAVELGRLDRGLSFLRDHDSRTVDGIITKPRIDKDKVLRGIVRFSAKEETQGVKQDIIDGIRPYISVGYIPKEAKLTEEKDGVQTWEITHWEPLEASTVAIPADATVGVGRAAPSGPNDELYEVTIRQEPAEPATREDQTMPPETTKPGEGNATATAPAPGEEVNAGTRTTDPHQTANDAAEIVRMCEAHGISGLAADWIAKRFTPGEAAQAILEHKRNSNQASAQPPAELLEGLSSRDRDRYSYVRAINQALSGRTPNGLEGEVHAELARSMPQGHANTREHSILVPMRIGPRPRKRAMTSDTAGAGAELVFDRPGELIELLKNKTAVLNRGAQLLTGLSAPITFPKILTGVTVHYVAENPASDVADTELTTGHVTARPRTLMGNVPISRQLLMQDNNIDTEAMVRDELTDGHSLAYDRAVLHGTGADGEPLGIYDWSGVNAKAMGGVPDYEKLIDMITLVAADNALRGSLGWLTTPQMAGKMLKTLEASAAGARFIWSGTLDDGTMVGYPASATNQVSATLGDGGDEHGIIFGNWRDCIICQWGALEIVVDPYSEKKKGLIEITTFQLSDHIFRHGESFAKATGATLT